MAFPSPTRVLLVLALAAHWGEALAQEPAASSPAQRPRIGLVLGGGGAKGAAHIGVLRVLDELRVPVDCVAGTSMGALVGATFSAGVPPAEIERRVTAVDWSATVGNAGRRDRTPISRKLQSTPYTNNLDLGIKGGTLRTPGGFIETQQIEELLRDLVAGARYIDDFNSLPIPFRAVATDMMKGEMVVLGEGDLTVAMRASMAVPGAFSPVVIGDRVLADGGQMRNLPVDIARQLCGEVIIAVSLESPQPKPEELTSALALASRSIDVMIEANGRAQLATLTDKDVSIVVPMGDIGSASFERVPDAIPLGHEAALGKAAELSRYALPPEEYARWRASVDRDYTKSFRVAGVTIAGTKRVNPEYVRAAIKETAAGAEVTPDQIAADTTRIYSLGDFETVGYRITSEPAYPTVEFTAIEKSWGPDYVTFDLGIGVTNGGDVAFALRGDYVRTWLNSLGAEWHSAVQIGDDTVVSTRFYQPLDVRQRFFVEPSAKFERNKEDVYNDGEREATYALYETFGQVDVGMNVNTRAQLRAGLRIGWDTADLYTGSTSTFPEVTTVQESDLVLRAVYDTRDASGLPSRGSLLIGQFTGSGSWLNGEASYETLEAMGLKVLPFRGDSLYLFGAVGSDLGTDLPPYRLFRLGGIRSFPGLERQQLRGSSYWVAGSTYYLKLADIQQLFGQALYGGLRVTAGEMRDRIDGIDDGVIYGLSGSVGGRTPIGPFLLSLGVTSNNFWQVQFALGRPIRESSILDEIW